MARKVHKLQWVKHGVKIANALNYPSRVPQKVGLKPYIKNLERYLTRHRNAAPNTNINLPKKLSASLRHPADYRDLH